MRYRSDDILLILAALIGFGFLGWVVYGASHAAAACEARGGVSTRSGCLDPKLFK